MDGYTGRNRSIFYCGPAGHRIVYELYQKEKVGTFCILSNIVRYFGAIDGIMKIPCCIDNMGFFIVIQCEYPFLSLDAWFLEVLWSECHCYTLL